MRIEGRVQGVFFRHYTQQEADRLGITGWVRNCEDGSVETLICGNDTQLNTMITWLKRGPSSAFVSDIRVEPEAASSLLSGFRITY